MTNSIDTQYQDLLKTILEFGIEKKDRTGVGTKSIFGYTIRHNMQEGFPALTTKKLFFKGVVGELIWFLRGDTNLRYLIENGIHIWTGDAYKKYEKWFENLQERMKNPQTDGDKEAAQFVDADQMKKLTQEEFESEIMNNEDFNQQFGNLGPIYGKQWRDWFHGDWWYNGSRPMVNENHIDQMADVIQTLKTNPDSRRMIVSAWNVGEIDSMTLPPCHTFFQFYTRELTLKERVDYGNRNNMWRLGQTISEMHCDALRIPKRGISLMWYQRSVDTLLGLPFNIASYALLLEIVAKMVDMMPDQLIGNLGDTHLYLNHLEQANEQIGRYFTDDELEEMYPDLKAVRDEKIRLIKELKYEEAAKCRADEKVMLNTIQLHTREPYPLPKLKFNKTDSFFRDGDINLVSTHLDIVDFELENYQHHKTIKAPLNN
jgi:thymidylate synthase